MRKKLTSARPALKNVSGQRLIAAPLLQVAHVLADSTKKNQWVSGLIEEIEIERSSDSVSETLPKESVAYQHYTLMPLLSDRDYVLSSIWEVEKEDEKVVRATLDIQSVEHAEKPPMKGRVRASLNYLVYRLEERAEADGTMVSVECNVDPLGNLPQAMVNLYASTWPEKTLAALEAQVLKN